MPEQEKCYICLEVEGALIQLPCRCSAYFGLKVHPLCYEEWLQAEGLPTRCKACDGTFPPPDETTVLRMQRERWEKIMAWRSEMKPWDPEVDARHIQETTELIAEAQRLADRGMPFLGHPDVTDQVLEAYKQRRLQIMHNSFAVLVMRLVCFTAVSLLFLLLMCTLFVVSGWSAPWHRRLCSYTPAEVKETCLEIARHALWNCWNFEENPASREACRLAFEKRHRTCETVVVWEATRMCNGSDLLT